VPVARTPDAKIGFLGSADCVDVDRGSHTTRLDRSGAKGVDNEVGTNSEVEDTTTGDAWNSQPVESKWG
jgi:hypothetical protein